MAAFYDLINGYDLIDLIEFIPNVEAIRKIKAQENGVKCDIRYTCFVLCSENCQKSPFDIRSTFMP